MERIELVLNVGGVRLDSAIASNLKERGFSRSRIQKLIDENLILLNGKKEKGSVKVKMGDRVTIDILENRSSDLVPLEFPLKVLYEDEDLFVVDKPANMVTHPSYGHRDDTLVNVLLSMNLPLSFYQGKERAGIVHRLDKETSGLLIIAKNEPAHFFLSKQFSERTIEKEYLALIWGTLKEDEMDVNLPIARDKKNRKKMAVNEGGKNARTIFKIVENLKFITLIKALPKTGRTHQIRVHLSYLNHPIVGDFLYGGHPENGVPSQIIKKAVKEANRFFLHSHKIVFQNCKGERVEVVSEIPEDFCKFMEIVRNYG